MHPWRNASSRDPENSTSEPESPLKGPRHLTLKRSRSPSLLRSRSRSRSRVNPLTLFPQTLPIPSTLLPNLQLLRIEIHYTRVATTSTTFSRRWFDWLRVAESGIEESSLSRRRGTGFEQASQGWRVLLCFSGVWWHCIVDLSAIWGGFFEAMSGRIYTMYH